MCIRDSDIKDRIESVKEINKVEIVGALEREVQVNVDMYKICLLYTSDAADERSSVDLGGRRIIKKKNSNASRGRWRTTQPQNTERIHERRR